MEIVKNTLYDDYNVEFYLKNEDFIVPVELTIKSDEFEDKKQLLNWIDFLIKTDQTIPYNLYKDIFGITEEEYKFFYLENVKEMKIRYERVHMTVCYVDLDNLNE